MQRLLDAFKRIVRAERGLTVTTVLSAAVWSVTVTACAADPETLTLSVGEAEILVPEGALGIHYWPDEGISVLPDPNKLRLIVAADVSTYLVEGEGKDVRNLTSAKQVLTPGEAHTFDSGYAGISAIYTAPDGTLYGFYHAEDHEDLPALDSGIPGFYASVGLATSSDGGSTWTKAGAVITSNQTKAALVASKAPDGGAGEPGVAVSPDGRYLYLYYTEHSRTDANGSSVGVQVCVARADLQEGPPAPGRFRKYEAGVFTEPGLGGNCASVINGLGFDYSDTLEAHVTHSAYAGRYLAVYSVVDWLSLQSGDGLGYSGLSYSTSDNGLNWTSPSRLIADLPLPTKGSSLSWEGTIVWDDAEERTGWLLYGSSPSWGDNADGLLPHTLTGRRVTLERH